MKRTILLLFLLFFLPLNADAKTEKVRAYEGDVSRPYTTLGTLEVKKKVSGLPELGAKTLDVVTLGVYYPEKGERYRRALKSILVSKASKLYGADAVIHVHYWPDPDSEAFPRGFIYARGEMIRYKSFPRS